MLLQNYFIFLGSWAERVCAIRNGEIEEPSGIIGVVYTDIDPSDGWKMNLARELKAAGYDLDVHSALLDK
jgi:hypothetical protein